MSDQITADDIIKNEQPEYFVANEYMLIKMDDLPALREKYPNLTTRMLREELEGITSYFRANPNKTPTSRRLLTVVSDMLLKADRKVGQ